MNKAAQLLVGCSAKQLIQQKILLDAKALLAYSDLSMKEICYEVGINEPSYFTLFFKKHTGLPPSEFRQQYQVEKV